MRFSIVTLLWTATWLSVWCYGWSQLERETRDFPYPPGVRLLHPPDAQTIAAKKNTIGWCLLICCITPVVGVLPINFRSKRRPRAIVAIVLALLISMAVNYALTVGMTRLQQHGRLHGWYSDIVPR